MERLDLHLKVTFLILLVVLGMTSRGVTSLIIWLIGVRYYPKAIDAEGVILRNGERRSWRELTRREKFVVRSGSRSRVNGVGLYFGNTTVKIAPSVLVEGDRVLPYISRIL